MKRWKWLASLILIVLLLPALQTACQKTARIDEREPEKTLKNKTEKKKKEAWQNYYLYFAHKDARNVSPARAYPVFRMKADGSELGGASFGEEQIFSEWGCSFSGDRNKVVWTEISGKRQISIINTDGTNKVVIKEGIEAYDPAISHDGNTVAFVIVQASGTEWMKENLAFADTENPENVVIIDNPYGESSANCPSYDAFGTRIYFDAQIHESRDIFSINAIDGKGMIRYTADRYVNTHPQVTPDGKKIIFVSDRNGKSDIYLIANRGITVPAEMVNPQEQEAKDSEREIFKNQQVFRLTYEGKNKDPSISPDGKAIAFSSDRDGNWEIYLMRVDGSGQKRLTQLDGDDISPRWSTR